MYNIKYVTFVLGEIEPYRDDIMPFSALTAKLEHDCNYLGKGASAIHIRSVLHATTGICTSGIKFRRWDGLPLETSKSIHS